jgi:hypothetical protein
MSTNASSTYSTARTHVVSFLTDKMLLSLGNIIRDSGLNMQNFTNLRPQYESGIKTWMAGGHLDKVVLEVFDPATSALLRRWDFDLYVDGAGRVEFWFDGQDIKYHLLKAGKVPATCSYSIIVLTKPGSPSIAGWSACELKDTSKLRQFSLGTTISANTSGTQASYWR